MAPHRPKRSACNACRQQKKRCSGQCPCTLCLRLGRQCVLPPIAGLQQPSPRAPGSVGAHGDAVPTPRDAHALPSSRSPTGQLGGPLDTLVCTTSSPFSPKSSHRHARVASSVWQVSAQPGLARATPPSGDEDLCGTDYTGDSLEPASPYSWLHRARLRIGRGSTRITPKPCGTTPAGGSIFTYGDAPPRQPPRSAIAFEQMPWELIVRLVDVYFERAMVTYHFLHLPTVKLWLGKLHAAGSCDVAPQERCIAMLVLCHGASYLTTEELAQIRDQTSADVSSEHLYNLAMSHLDLEQGQPNTESVQARLIQVHHLLSTARPNQAWYILGAVVQLVWALTLHRESPSDEASLQQQLRSRTFWCIYATDKYVSVTIGRPVLIRDDLISQKLPLLIDDDDLGTGASADPDVEPRDCSLSATLHHVVLSRLLARAICEQRETNQDMLFEAVARNKEALQSWKESLPPLLSGQVQPSSLIPKFRRQAVVLRIFYLNATILINRPLLLRPQPVPARLGAVQESTEACLAASKELARQFVQFHREGQRAATYWYTQSITFNSLSILYMHLLRSLQVNRSIADADADIFALAQEAHASLQANSEGNAPNFRYCLVLDELGNEVRNLLDATLPTASPYPGFVAAPHAGFAVPDARPGEAEPLMQGFEGLDGSFWDWFDDLSNVQLP